MKVNETDPRVAAMAEDWALVDALMGGTKAMRAAGEKYLPKWTLEDPSDYAARLKIATLFPAFEQTVKEMTGRAFADQVQLGDDVPAWIRDDVWPDVDRQGINGHAWARGWFAGALAKGLNHVLVDAPPAVLPDGREIRTQADQKAARAQPYLIRIAPERILGWKVGSDGQLSQVRITWSRTEPGEFADKTIPQIRVYERVGEGVAKPFCRIRVYEERENAGKQKEWVEIPELAISTDIEVIPLVTCYTNRTGLLCAEPPLRELGYMNTSHWSQQCSTASLLQTAGVPILAAIGLNEENPKLLIGSKNAVMLPVGGDMKYVEHSGKAISAGRDALKDMEGQMKAIGAKLLEPGGATKTATQASEEASSSNSPLGAMVEDLEDALEQLLYVIGLYRNETTGGSVEVKADLDPDTAPIESMGVIGKMVATGGLSRATQFAEAQRRGIVSPELDWEEEQTRIETDGPKVTEPKVDAK